MSDNAKRTKFIWLFAAIFLSLIPLIIRGDEYIMHTIITISFNVGMATSMWLLWTLGFVSFAHAGFMGVGAYTSAVFLLKFGWPFWATFLMGSFVTATVAALISLPLMRTRAVYFFMASWAVGEVIKRIFAYFKGTFGGWNGIFDINPPEINLSWLHIDFSNRIAYYYLAVSFAFSIVFIIYRINKSRTGAIFWSIHENETVSEHMGINALKFKVMAFTLASTFAGMTGIVYAHYHTYINPKTFDIWQSEFALIFMIVGGLATVVGPVIGASVLTIMDELLRPQGYYRVIIYGVILIFTVLFMKDGLESLPGKIKNLYLEKFKNNKSLKSNSPKE